MSQEQVEQKITQLVREVDASAAKHNMLLGQLVSFQEILAEMVKVKTEEEIRIAEVVS